MSSLDKKIKVLVVDDHQVLRRGLISILSEVDFIDIVGEAENGKETMDFLEEYAVDVVLLDIEMPVMNGNETLIKIKEKYPNVKVIMFTTHHTLGYEAHFLKLGAKAYLVKNSDYETISNTINRVYKEDFVNSINDVDSSKISDEHLRQSLSDREKEVISLICKDFNNDKIAETLGIKKFTVKYIRKVISKKTRTNSLRELILYAYKEGLIPLE